MGDGDAAVAKTASVQVACGPLYNAQYPDSGCFGIVNGLCKIVNPECLKIQCLADKMTGYVRADAMGFKKDSPPTVDQFSINNQECAEANLVYDENGYKFELDYGSCGMSVSNVEDSIVFETELSASAQAVVSGGTTLYLENSFSPPMRFKCAFDTTATTEAHDITVSVTSLGEQEIEETGNAWTNVELNFFNDNSFNSEIAANGVHDIGDSVYAKISWTDERDTDFPVSFYVRGCSVTDGSKSFNVFENDCPQAIINAGFSGEAVSTTEVKLFWESFSFSEESGQHTQTVECTVQFCITEECAPNNCNEP